MVGADTPYWAGRITRSFWPSFTEGTFCPIGALCNFVSFWAKVKIAVFGGTSCPPETTEVSNWYFDNRRTFCPTDKSLAVFNLVSFWAKVKTVLKTPGGLPAVLFDLFISFTPPTACQDTQLHRWKWLLGLNRGVNKSSCSKGDGMLVNFVLLG